MLNDGCRRLGRAALLLAALVLAAPCLAIAQTSGGYSASYPSDIRAGAGFKIVKQGLALRISADYSSVPLLGPTVTAGSVLVQDPTTGELARLDISNLPSSVPRDASVTLAKFSAVPAFSFIGNATGATATPQYLAPSQARTALALDRVSNTADADKPISTAQATALAGKAPIASPVFTGPVTLNTLTMTGSGSTGDVSGMSVTPTGAQIARALSSKLRDFGVSVLDFGPSVGTGGDDSAAINAAITQAVSNPGKAGKVVFPTPPLGAYNVCQSPVELPGGATHLTMEGAVGSGVPVRLLPGCASGITSVLHQTNITSQSSRVRINNMIFDGRAGTQYVAHIEYAVGWTATNTIFRNAAKGGSTVYLAGGYEFSIGDGNKIENVNDLSLPAQDRWYKATEDLPDYGLRTRSTDSYFTGLIAINANIATIFNENGGGNNYTGTHPWGYTANAFGEGGPDMRPQYAFLINGIAHVTGAIADNFRLAGYYLRNDQYGSRAQVVGSNCIGANSTGAACILLADGLNSPLVVGNSVVGVSDPVTNGIRREGTLAGSPIIRANSGSSFETAYDIQNVAGGDTLRLESYGAGGGIGLRPISPNAATTTYISDKGGGGIVLQSNGEVALSASNPASAVNRFEVVGNTTGFGPVYRAAGSDTNIAPTIIGKGTGGVNLGAYTSQAADPTTTNIPAGRCADWHNSTAATFKRWCNFGGALRSVAYQ